MVNRHIGRRWWCARTPRTWQPVLAGLVLLLLFAAVPSTGAAQQAPAGTSSRAKQQEAIDAIPFDDLNEAVVTKLTGVLNKPSIYRQLPVQVVESDPDLYVFLIRHPEVIVNMWQLMGITNVQIERTGPYTFDTADGAGTVASVELVYGRPDLHIFYADGYYEGQLLKNRIPGSCVIVLRTSYSREDGRIFATNCMDVFVRLDHVAVDLVARTMQPLVGKAADYNFVESSKFMGQVAAASETNGPGMQRLSERLTNIKPTVRESFAHYAEVAYQRAVLRDAETEDGSPPVLSALTNSNTAHPAEDAPLPVTMDLTTRPLPRQHNLQLRR